MRLLLPGASVDYYTTHAITRRYARMTDFVREVGGHDLVFANHFKAPFRDGSGFDALRAGTNLVQIPIIVFSAFHPDMNYVGPEDGAAGRGVVRGPMNDSNSALALFGFLEGLSVAQTIRLFDADLFRALGYFDCWAGSAEYFLSQGREAGYDLSEDLARWTRRGAFMHSINHPKMFVTSDLARGLLRRAGIPFTDCDLDSYLPDDFIRQGTWPIYGPIADYYGVPGGSYVFLRRQPGLPPTFETLGLEQFLTETFAAYGRYDRADLSCARVEGWRSDEAVRAAILGRAGRR